MNTRSLLAAVAFGAAVTTGACGGGDSDKTPTSAPVTATAAVTRAATSAATPARTSSPSGTSAATVAATAPVAGTTSAPAASGRVFDETQGLALLDEASIKPEDIEAGWTIMNDTPTDNAAAAAADPANAPSIERCGRLAGRLITNSPPDVTNAYITGELVSVFSQLTVYRTAEGATDCAAEGAQRFTQPGALARAFGTVFVTPDAVTVQPLDYPAVADGSFAAALTGDINAGGLTVQLQIIIVAFRSGNTTAVVGVAQSPLSTPSATIAKPYVDKVAAQIAANQ